MNYKSIQNAYNHLTKTIIVIKFHPKPRKPEPPQRGRQQSKIEFPIHFKLYDTLIKAEILWEQFREKFLYTAGQLAHYTWKKSIQHQKEEFEHNVIDL